MLQRTWSGVQVGGKSILITPGTALSTIAHDRKAYVDCKTNSEARKRERKQPKSPFKKVKERVRSRTNFGDNNE